MAIHTDVYTPVAVATVPPKSARAVFNIKGMYCESCEKTIRAMLMRTPGVESATVSAKTAQAVVVYDASRTQPAALLATITRLGYSAHQQVDKANRR